MNTILVVDDRPDARYALVRTLTGAGYDVRETATGRDALRLARLFPDLIVLDIALQDMDGFEVCRRLKMDAVTSAMRWQPTTGSWPAASNATGTSRGRES